MPNGGANATAVVTSTYTDPPSNNRSNMPSPLSSPQLQQQGIDVEAAEVIPSRGRSQSLRRQSITLNAVINHRRALFGALFQNMGSNMSLTSCVPSDQDHHQLQQQSSGGDEGAMATTTLAHHKLQLAPVNSSSNPYPPDYSLRKEKPEEHRRRQHAELMSSLSTLYAKLLVVVGVAVPVTASVSHQVPAALDRGFYLYLYFASVAFVVTMYTTLLRDKALKTMIAKHVAQETTTTTYIFDNQALQLKQPQSHQQRPLDCKCPSAITHTSPSNNNSNHNKNHHSHNQQYGSFCLRLGTVGFGAGSLVFTGLQIGAELANGPVLRALIPATRLLLVTAQMHFIFLNSKDLVLTRHEAFAKLGLMHMIATNVCEWLQALVEETRCEIVQLEQHDGEGETPSGAGMLRKLLRDASPFLFPCTIEFSLICAVILFEMWKRVDERNTTTVNVTCSRSVHQLSIDCGSAHRGLFGGILVVAATVLSLIMFFVLKEAKPQMAIEQVTSLEVAIQSSGMIAAVIGGLKIRALDFRNAKPPHLDSTLLAAAQAGVYLHCLFGAVGSILTQGPSWMICLAADFLAMLQSTTQTLLIKIAWRRRSRSNEKPGKELITFLIVVNIAMWTVNTLEKSRAGVRPDHLEFFGVWAWTIITHVSMPLAIFYRFHSAICLFEVWKSCYKYRPPVGPVTPY